jgi:hypothetical protein
MVRHNPADTGIGEDMRGPGSSGTTAVVGADTTSPDPAAGTAVDIEMHTADCMSSPAASTEPAVGEECVHRTERRAHSDPWTGRVVVHGVASDPDDRASHSPDAG